MRVTEKARLIIDGVERLQLEHLSRRRMKSRRTAAVGWRGFGYVLSHSTAREDHDYGAHQHM